MLAVPFSFEVRPPLLHTPNVAFVEYVDNDVWGEDDFPQFVDHPTSARVLTVYRAGTSTLACRAEGGILVHFRVRTYCLAIVGHLRCPQVSWAISFARSPALTDSRNIARSRWGYRVAASCRSTTCSCLGVIGW